MITTLPFIKYQALGNDYLVVVEDKVDGAVDAAVVRRICDRHRGVGSDGILLDCGLGAPDQIPHVRVFNPDGSVAEKSGNGLRIFARYLWDRGNVQDEPFSVRIWDEIVTCRMLHEGRVVSVEMGRVRFEAIEQQLDVAGTTLTYSAASIGNPHCVILRDEVSEEEARRPGPHIEVHPAFPNRTNVQFVKVLDRENIRLEIWERGAGYTLASGSSTSAASAVVRRLGLCEASVTAHMPGGQLEIEIRDDFGIRMTGPVVKVAEGSFAAESLADLT